MPPTKKRQKDTPTVAIDDDLQIAPDLDKPQPKAAPAPPPTIHLIIVAYHLPHLLWKTLTSIESQRYQLHWHIFTHSSNADVQTVIRDFEKTVTKPHQITVYDYRQNRGLAKSYNEGLQAAQQAGATHMIILADDIVCSGNSLDQFIAQVEQLDLDTIFRITVQGYVNSIASIEPQGYNFTLMTPAALNQIGYFDENFFPVYWYDVDYDRRGKLAGLQKIVLEQPQIVHEGSASLHINSDIKSQHYKTFTLNRDYYVKKWGGLIHEETYQHPFNDPHLSYQILTPAESFAHEYARTDFRIVRV